MANYAALIDVLSVAGSRLSDGTPNASGSVYFFQPGTNTPVSAYSDAAATTVITQPVTLNSGGLLSTSDFPNGIFVTRPVRLLVQDVSGNSVVDTTYIPATAGDVGVSNAGFTDPTLDAVLTKAFTSFGGQDWNYKESTGATARTVKSKFAEIWISVKDFGAVGDGVAIDTTAIQAAFNRVKALGGGTVWFPAGTYKIDQAITATSVTGLTVAGAGIQATIITSTHATADAFTFATCDGMTVSNLSIRNSGTSTGKAISMTTCLRPIIDHVATSDASLSDGVYRYAVWLSGCTSPVIRWSHLYGIAADAAARGLYALDSPAMTTIGGDLHATAGYPVEFDGIGGANMYGTTIAGSARFAATLTLPLFFNFIGSSITALSIATATIPYIRMVGTGLDASATSSAVGAAQTPSLIAGNEVILSATSGGAGVVTVNAPAILPGTGASAGVDLYWDFVYKNQSGGAVTWTQNAVFVTTAAIPTTDGHTIGVRYRWDRTTSKLREVSRADTVT